MKRTICIALLTAISAAAIPAKAENPAAEETEVQATVKTPYRSTKNEISVSYGIFTFGEVFIYPFVAIGGSINRKAETHIPGVFSLEYFHFPKQGRVGYGVIVACDPLYQTAYSIPEEGDPTPPQLISNLTMTGTSIMPAIKVGWFNTKYFGMYSKAGLGLWLVSQHERVGNSFSIQPNIAAFIAPVGMDFGSEKVRGYIEIGAGWQGVISGGLRVNL